MKVQARMIEDNQMEVTFGGKTKIFKTREWADEKQSFRVADYVFASTVARRGKDWPVSVLVGADGSTSIFWPSGVTLNRGAPRISCFWEDSQNKSRHNKV